MDIVHIVLILATLLCSLTAGLVFAFAVVVMPGLRSLRDRDFIRAFQVIDGVIQKGQPLFVFVWVGSAVGLLVAAVLGFRQMVGVERVWLVALTAVYLLGVQLPTGVINVPLNNRLQAVDVDGGNDAAVTEARGAFEARWNRWNWIRTVAATLTAAGLMTVLLRL